MEETKHKLETCAICDRPLEAVASVELGIGPVCRKKNNVESGISGATVQSANAILATIVREGASLEALRSLEALGLPNLAMAIGKKASKVEVRTEGDILAIGFDYSVHLVETVRALPGRRWDKLRKVWTVPAEHKAEVWSWMIRELPGELGIGPAGIFEIPRA
jgi:hypothetical protein